MAVPPDPQGFVVASHEALFEEGQSVCDACGAALEATPADGGGADRYRLGGEGVYMWTRGDRVRFDPAPLCSDCAAAIGVTALARWEIEEEEG